MPEILAKAGPGVSFIVPTAVLRELERRDHPEWKKLVGVIQDAASRGEIEIIEDNRASGPPTPADQTIVRIMATKGQGTDLILATEDRDLLISAAKLGVPVVDSAALSSSLASAPVSDQSLLEKARSVVARQLLVLLSHFLVSLIAAILANLAASRLSRIVATINIWGTLLLLVTLALTLYWFRGRYRLIYGSTECLIGFSAAARVFWPRFVYSELKTTDALQIVAGLYVMIRGLDNIGKALAGTRWEKPWRLLSGE